jgi:hypothetical protein
VCKINIICENCNKIDRKKTYKTVIVYSIFLLKTLYLTKKRFSMCICSKEFKIFTLYIQRINIICENCNKIDRKKTYKTVIIY